jgi:hypothetical protein
MKRKTIISLAIMVLFFSSITTAFAQAEGETPACSGDSVSGTVVAVDEEAGLATIDMGDGNLCTVSLSSAEYEHPIIALLDMYFSGSDGEDVAAAFEGTQKWMVYDEGSGTWGWAAEGDEGAVKVTVNSVTDNGDGTFTVVFTPEGAETPETIIVGDIALADELSGNLEALNVNWNLLVGEEGTSIADAGDEIAAYHEDGVGFGVLVKLYAIVKQTTEACLSDAENCIEVSVAQLVEEFDSGKGIGSLFKDYGKPTLLGVGHVRQELKEEKGGKKSSYEVDGSVWVVYDEDSEVWVLADEGDEGALPATIIGVTDNGDGTQTLELSVEGVGGSVFITVEAGKKGKPDKSGKSDKDNKGKGKPGAEVGSKLWVAYDVVSGAWTLVDEEDEGALAATVVAITEDEDGNEVLELSVEGVVGSVFVTVEGKGKGKPEGKGKPDKPEKPEKKDNPNKP